MSEKVIYLPKGRLRVKEREKTYSYTYEEAKANVFEKKRQWQKHEGKGRHSRPHVHVFVDGMKIKEDTKWFTKKHNLRIVLEKIKKDFDNEINVESIMYHEEIEKES